MAIDRIFPKFDRVIVALNLEVYKMAMWAAITEKNQWSRTLFCDQLAAQFQYCKVRDEVEKDLPNLSLVGIKTVPPKPIDSKWVTKWTKYREVVPSRWRYWDDNRGVTNG